MHTPLRVLILEDQPADAELLVRELRRAGFDPHWQRVEAESDYLAHLDPALDVILADYRLPQFDAMRALQLVQERGLELPFIVVSGAISEEVAVECMKRGAADYLLKDRLARLGPAVAQALEQHRLRRERKRAEETRHALYQASLQIQESLGLEQRLDRLLQTAQTVLELDRVIILFAAPEGRWLQAVATLGVQDPLGAIRVPIGPGGGGLAQAYVSQQPIFWDGLAPMPEPLRLQPPYDRIDALRSRAFALLPLVVQGRAIGVLGADRKHSRRPLDAATRELLQLFAGQAALAIEQARLYETQRMAAIQLEATVEARTRELQAMNAQLQEATRQAKEASRHKSEFLANVSHELRTPLNSILGFSELLQEQAYGLLAEERARYVDNIHRSGQHLLALMSDLLDLSKVEAGKLELRREAIELREALSAALAEIRPQAEAKGLQLALQVDPALVTLTADPVRFKQILLNLLSNAVKFTPAGGAVTVTARIGSRGKGLGSSEGSRPDPIPSTLYPGGFVEIAVADTGIGITAEDLPKLFQPFTQLEPSFVKQHQGTGLGLALTKHLVELHDGAIWAASDGEGRGSTFTIRLPLDPQARRETGDDAPANHDE